MRGLREAYNAAMRRRVAAAGRPAELANVMIEDVGRVTGENLGRLDNRALYGDLGVDLDELEQFVGLTMTSATERVAAAGGGRPARELAASIAGDAAALGLLVGLLMRSDS